MALESVLLDDGSSCNLSQINEGKPFILVFLRHFGCIFCRYQVAQLRPVVDLPIFFVGMGGVEETAAFKKRMRSPHRFIADPERKLYEMFGVPRGRTRQMLTLRTIGRGIQATFSGQVQGKPTRDPMQLGAAFVLDGSGKVRWSRIAEDAADVVSPEILRDQLLRVGQEEPVRGGEDQPSRDHPSAGY